MLLLIVGTLKGFLHRYGGGLRGQFSLIIPCYSLFRAG